MASYRGHLMLSSSVGLIYGGVGVNPLGFDPATGLLAAGATAVGGMLPDLDSDSGRPVRELFSLSATFAVIMLMPRLSHTDFSMEETLVALGMVYVLIRYGLSRIFNLMTVHRGMFHSIPAMLIAGLTMFIVYDDARQNVRIFLACGVMLGFLSHLVLDELYSVNLDGVTISLNRFAGSALKFVSPSPVATATAYAILAGMTYLAYQEYQEPHPGFGTYLSERTRLNLPKDLENFGTVRKRPLAEFPFSSQDR